ncbi:hypothetical protein B9Z45_13180 [Limnohabitans sp. 2KL-17]|uniref:hypothetical protein n=1 Tax=Limnohabitans sp. 2KL-17 TaxID=1100704 RepID=UPI000D3557B5|nr:hypothetical protein [Limnohabitans sp. 2KL-17]PUE53045.1 hypothetical protein B9Z45_13180 [Limnohabitans sp. 2KL-17]
MIYRLLTLRLRWYSEATALLLLRRWQAIVLVLGVFGGSLLVESSHLVLALLDERHGLAWRLGAIGLWQGCWCLWALMQIDQIRGGRFRDFAQSLPLTPRHWRATDLLVLLVSNTPLLLPFFAAAFVLGARQGLSWEALRGGLLIVFLLASQFVCQLSAMQGRIRGLGALVVADVWVAGALSMHGPMAAALLAPAATGALWSLWGEVPALPLGAAALFSRVHRLWMSLSRRLIARLPPLIRLALAILYRQHRSSMFGKLFSCLLVVFVAEGLMSIWAYDGRSLPMALIAAGLVAMSISGLYRHLQMAHDEARPFTAALPMRRGWTVPGDTLAVLSFGLPFVLAMVGLLWWHAALSAELAAGFVSSFALLVVVLRRPQLSSSRNAVLSTALVVGLWTFTAATILLP